MFKKFVQKNIILPNRLIAGNGGVIQTQAQAMATTQQREESYPSQLDIEESTGEWTNMEDGGEVKMGGKQEDN